MKESTLVDNIRKVLKKRGVKTLKIHGNAYHEAGTPDIVGCYDGHFLALEVKRDEKSKPTPLQVQRLAEWYSAGAITAVVWSVTSAIAVLEGE